MSAMRYTRASIRFGFVLESDYWKVRNHILTIRYASMAQGAFERPDRARVIDAAVRAIERDSLRRPLTRIACNVTFVSFRLLWYRMVFFVFVICIIVACVCRLWQRARPPTTNCCARMTDSNSRFAQASCRRFRIQRSNVSHRLNDHDDPSSLSSSSLSSWSAPGRRCAVRTRTTRSDAADLLTPIALRSVSTCLVVRFVFCLYRCAIVVVVTTFDDSKVLNRSYKTITKRKGRYVLDERDERVRTIGGGRCDRAGAGDRRRRDAARQRLCLRPPARYFRSCECVVVVGLTVCVCVCVCVVFSFVC
jgi:hypothetical protein